MKLNTVVLLAIFAILLSACNRNVFIANDFDIKTTQHNSIAVLPVAIEMRGAENNPFEFEAREIIESKESVLFQQELFNQILRSTKQNKRPIRVNVQHFQTTINKLENAGYSIRDSWGMRSEELAQLLGVDAVVRSKILKNRYLPDATAFVLSTFQRGISQATGFNIPGPFNRTGNIQINLALIDGKDTTTLWNFGRTLTTAWNRPGNQIVRQCYRSVSKKFPYRI